MNMSDISLHNPLIGAVIIITVVSISVVIQLSSNKWFSNDHFDNMQNVSGIYMSAVGTLYSVVLGLLLVDASDDFSNAKRYVEQESNALVKVYAASLRMPERYIPKIASSVERYVDYVISDEWSKMPDRDIKEETKSLFTQIWYTIYAIEPENENQKAIYPLMLQSFEDALENRIERITYSNYTLTWIEWLCLISGGIITITFMLFFKIGNKVAHAIMTGMVSFMVSINLYAVYMLSEPFNGYVQLPIERFKFLSAYIKETTKSRGIVIPDLRIESETNHPPLPLPEHHASPSSSRNR